MVSPNEAYESVFSALAEAFSKRIHGFGCDMYLEQPDVTQGVFNLFLAKTSKNCLICDTCVWQLHVPTKSLLTYFDVSDVCDLAVAAAEQWMDLSLSKTGIFTGVWNVFVRYKGETLDHVFGRCTLGQARTRGVISCIKQNLDASNGRESIIYSKLSEHDIDIELRANATRANRLDCIGDNPKFESQSQSSLF